MSVVVLKILVSVSRLLKGLVSFYTQGDFYSLLSWTGRTRDSKSFHNVPWQKYTELVSGEMEVLVP